MVGYNFYLNMDKNFLDIDVLKTTASNQTVDISNSCHIQLIQHFNQYTRSPFY